MREYERSEHGLGTETKSDLAYLSLGSTFKRPSDGRCHSHGSRASSVPIPTSLFLLSVLQCINMTKLNLWVDSLLQSWTLTSTFKVLSVCYFKKA